MDPHCTVGIRIPEMSGIPMVQCRSVMVWLTTFKNRSAKASGFRMIPVFECPVLGFPPYIENITRIIDLKFPFSISVCHVQAIQLPLPLQGRQLQRPEPRS